MSKKLYQFELDWGRVGSLSGLFIEDEENIKQIIGEEVDFGEAMGKHSDVVDTMTEDMFTIVDVPESVLEVLETKLGKTLSGYNPLDFYFDENDL